MTGPPTPADRLVFWPHRGRVAVTIGAALFFAAMTIDMLREAVGDFRYPTRVLPLLLVALFCVFGSAVVLVVGVRTLLWPRPLLVVDAQGIRGSATDANALLAWEDIKRLAVVSAGGYRGVGIWLHAPEAYTARRPRPKTSFQQRRQTEQVPLLLLTSALVGVKADTMFAQSALVGVKAESMLAQIEAFRSAHGVGANVQIGLPGQEVQIEMPLPPENRRE